MALPIVTTPQRGAPIVVSGVSLPVVEAENGFGIPVTIAGNGYGLPVFLTSSIEGPPINIVPPVASGELFVGATLSCTTGLWIGTAPITYGYQWYEWDPGVLDGDELLLVDGVAKLALVNGVDNLLFKLGSSRAAPRDISLPGETGPTFVVPVSGFGKYYYCVVTATNAFGAASAQSNTLGPMLEDDEMPPPTTLITDLVGTVSFFNSMPGAVTSGNVPYDEIWLSWTPVPGSKGTVIYRSRTSGTPPLFTNWEACRVAYPGNTYRDGCEGPLDRGRSYTYQAAAYYNNGEGPLSTPVTARTPIPWTGGYQALVYAHIITNTTTQGWISDYTATYNIATAPVDWGGGNIYYFISSQSIYFNVPVGYQLSLLQPVVAYGAWGDEDNPEMGGDYWWLANWIIHQSRFYVGPAMALPGGVTSLTGKIVRNAAFSYTSKFVEYPALDMSMSGMEHEENPIFCGYEYYGGANGIGDWTHQPGDMVFAISNASLSIAGSGMLINYSTSRATLSGTTQTVTNNNTATPTVTFHTQKNNDWVPVNM